MKMRNPLKPSPNHHWIKSQGWEATIGLIILVLGCMLLWDAFDNRGRKMPWPAGGLAPW